MNKRILTAAAVLLTLTAAAQNYSVLDEVRTDARKAAGIEGPYLFETTALTPSPKGYKPFYISHYGRHGSRYSWTTKTYTTLLTALNDAKKADNLTAYGEDFLSRLEAFSPIPLENTGDLVPLGAEQHERLAKEMYEAFPKVFKGSCKVDARSSTTARCGISMAAFCTSLQKQNPGISISFSSNHMGMRELVPTSAPSAYKRTFKGADYPEMESLSSFSHRVADYQGILGKLFKDPSFLKNYDGGETFFLEKLYYFIGSYPNYSDPALFSDLLTPEQHAGLWEVFNYSLFLANKAGRFNMIPLLEDFVSKADGAIEGNGIAADLRFGHDFVMEAFNCLINTDGYGTVPQKADDVKYWFQSYRVPMAATIMFVLYRSPRHPSDILFKFLWNGKEAAFPDLEPVSGPYYRWSDFHSFAEKIIRDYPEIPKED